MRPGGYVRSPLYPACKEHGCERTLNITQARVLLICIDPILWLGSVQMDGVAGALVQAEAGSGTNGKADAAERVTMEMEALRLGILLHGGFQTVARE